MTRTLPTTLQTVRLVARSGRRAAGRTEQWLRMYTWPGHVELNDDWSASIDPCRRNDGLYCREPGGEGIWVTPAHVPAESERAAIGPLAEALIRPWGERVLALAPPLAEAAAETERRFAPKARPQFSRTVAILNSYFDLGPDGVFPRFVHFALAETADPGRRLLAIYSPPRYGHLPPPEVLELRTHDPERLDTRLSWGRHEDPAWATLRHVLVDGFGPPLSELLRFRAEPARLTAIS
jgi:hypothetical protein